MQKTWLNLVLGIALWLVVFAARFALMPLSDPDVVLFKTAMVVVGSLVGVVLLAFYFLRVGEPYLMEGLTVGIVWFVIIVVLDLAVLVPMLQMGLWQYFVEIGFRYLPIIIVALGFGFVLDRKAVART